MARSVGRLLLAACVAGALWAVALDASADPNEAPAEKQDGPASTASAPTAPAPATSAPATSAPATPAPASPAAAEQAETTVTGAIVLGLLPYTIAEGAFGMSASAGADDFAKDAGVLFGPAASLGVTNWLTLGASVPFVSAPVDDNRVTGLGKIGVTAQFMFYTDKASGLSLAATPGVALPSPTKSSSTSVVPDLKASGAVNFGPVALNLTARGSVDVASEGDAAPTPGFDSALSFIVVNDTWAPFLEAGICVADGATPVGAAGLNFAPGGGAILTAGVPVSIDGDTVKAGVSFTAYFETELWGGSKGATKVSANPVVR